MNESFTYDANGNILTLTRYGTSAQQQSMDDLTYNYYSGTNRLEYVEDIVDPDNYTTDIDDQNSGNYTYDEIGNLKSDAQEGISDIAWTVYGKIKSITKTGSGDHLEFKYDAQGNRIAKIAKPSTTLGTPSTWTTTYYLRDAQGNALATYEDKPNDAGFHIMENALYGSSRLGIMRREIDLLNLPTGGEGHYSGTRGKKAFELSNHLGNVLAVVSDQKKGIDDTGSDGIADYYIANVRSATDYYAFGAPMPGRSFNSNQYRFGYNGQEKDDEISGSGNHYTATYWEMDPRIGRRWNLDPKYFAGESRYAILGNNPIIYVDPKGDFKTKFGAWFYKTTHGGEIGGEKGNYYVNRSSVDAEGVVNIRPWVYDWNGGTTPYTGSGWGHQARSLVANIFGVNGKASSLTDMGVNSMLQNSSVQLTGDLLEKVKQDPAVQRLENDIVRKVQSQSQYGKEAFTYSAPNNPVQLGGQRGSLNPLDPNSAATWQVAANPLTWAVRSVNIQAQVQVTAEGCMNITYSFTDNFDLRPERGGKVYFGGSGDSPFSSGGGNRPWQYNAATSVLGVGYHDIFGGNDQMKVNATWTSER